MMRRAQKESIDYKANRSREDCKRVFGIRAPVRNSDGFGPCLHVGMLVNVYVDEDC